MAEAATPAIGQDMEQAGEDVTILVVDDFDDHREILVDHLELLGYRQVVEAGNGEEALQQLSAQSIDLVILDVVMPKMNGYGVLKKMRADETLTHVPVIMISALSEFETAIRCIEQGAEDYLTKPFNPAVLKARVGACLDKKRMRDRERAYLEAIDRERQRADELLYAILPAPAVRELKSTDRIAPREFAEVAVLFADIVGFTEYCESHAPNDVVSNLDRLAELSETIVRDHRLEKIKTVGDGLMATANLLESNPDPVMAAVRCGFDLVEAAESLWIGWKLRIGIHVGPVMAGMIGRTKFTYDLWGDTVNVAARLAGIGPGAAVYLSGEAWARIAGRCQGEPVEGVAIKGKEGLAVYRCLKP